MSVVAEPQAIATLKAISDPSSNLDAGTVEDTLARVETISPEDREGLLAENKIYGATPLAEVSDGDRLALINALLGIPALREELSRLVAYVEANDVTPAELEKAISIAAAGPKWRENIGPWFSDEGVAKALDVSAETVSEMAEAGAFIELETADHVIVFPAFQFEDGKVVQALVQAHARLTSEGNMSAWTAASWLMTSDDRLSGESVRDWFVRVDDQQKLDELITEDITPFAA